MTWLSGEGGVKGLRERKRKVGRKEKFIGIMYEENEVTCQSLTYQSRDGAFSGANARWTCQEGQCVFSCVLDQCVSLLLKANAHIGAMLDDCNRTNPPVLIIISEKSSILPVNQDMTGVCKLLL